MDLELDMRLQALNIGELEDVIKACQKRLKELRKADPLYRACLAIWDRYYKLTKGIDYVYSPKDYNHMKLLIGKLRKCQPDMKDITLSQFLSTFLLSIDNNFVLQNLTISMVNSKFNELLSKASKEIQQKEETNQLFKQFDK